MRTPTYPVYRVLVVVYQGTQRGEKKNAARSIYLSSTASGKKVGGSNTKSAGIV